MANWEGQNCTSEILDCRRTGDETYSCGEHGFCLENEAGAGCLCDPGWLGPKVKTSTNISILLNSGDFRSI